MITKIYVTSSTTTIPEHDVKSAVGWGGFHVPASVEHQIIWTPTYDDGFEKTFCTNKYGEGGFAIEHGRMQQYTGTMQLSYHNETPAGIEARFRKKYAQEIKNGAVIEFAFDF